MIARLLFILYKQENHVIPKHYYLILRTLFCLSYFIAICIASFAIEKDFKFNLIEIIILILTTLVIPADILDHTGREEDILLQNLEYTFISKLSQPRIIYDSSKNFDFLTFHDIASSESVYTTVFNRKAVKTIKMIDFYWKGKDK